MVSSPFGEGKALRGGVTLDLYNQKVIPKVCCTITTRIDSSNNIWLMTMENTTDYNRKEGVIYTDPRTGKKYRIAIRKYTPRDCFRLMGVRDSDFDKLLATDGNGKRLLSNSKLYEMAGNSIVTECMVGIFENLFYPEGKNNADRHGQLSLF